MSVRSKSTGFRIARASCHGRWEAVTADSVAERGAQAVGRSSFCAAELGDHGETVYADDLGLRRIILQSGGRSFSTVALVRSLAEDGQISREEMVGHMVWLAQQRYFAVPMDEELICRTFRDCEANEVVKVLTVAAIGTRDLGDVARAGARALKSMATGPVGVSLAVATRMILAAMTAKWDEKGAGWALAREVAEQFVVLPRQLGPILRECRRHGK